MKNLSKTSVQYIKGVGPAKKQLLANLGIVSVEDLFYFFPRRYEDRRHLTKIAQVKEGEWQTISGTILTQGSRRSWFTRKRVTEIIVDDNSGRIFCVWFNQPYLENYLKEGRKIVCHGKVGVYNKRLQMIVPEYEVLADEDDEQLSMGRIVPIYPLTRGITQRFLRKIIKHCLDHYKADLVDELPVPLRNQYRLANIKRSINQIHFPEESRDQELALKRISFEEFYFFQVAVILRRLSITRTQGIAHHVSDAQALAFVNSFPFALTSAQKRVIREIREDMQKETPMLRLLQGDVGSGKTLAALFGCYTAWCSQTQSCIMAPTEILARQHYENIRAMTGKGILSEMKIALWVSGLSVEEKKGLAKKIREGKIDLVVGTHALLGEDLDFKHLSFIVIDEQHKFGVRQRALLAEKGTNPDMLIMTATPIPRTLCLTLYGDLDISVIDEMPPGRGAVKTHLYPFDQEKDVYKKVRAQLDQGGQAYIIYPIIEESEKLDVKAAKDMFKYFKEEEFKDFRVGLVHGQMKREKTDEVMGQFTAHKIDVLVATTILEVGVDVPNASVMVIEHAERFGLAQLHQLRGRIGRGAHDAVCLLLADPHTQESQQRLDALLSTNDGFKIAQYDLEIRGPGRFFDRHQHGLNELKVANPATQLDILELARKEALALTGADPQLQKNMNIRKVIEKRYPTYLGMANAG
jgi:ATP-dependent DNA helicase RecG